MTSINVEIQETPKRRSTDKIDTAERDRIAAEKVRAFVRHELARPLYDSFRVKPGDRNE